MESFADEVFVRVLAGAKKGIELRCGHGPFFRPTAQVVRGSLFNTLGADVEGAAFLDLFAGSGAVGIEALSRGASRVVFVEQDHAILKALRTNLERCGFGLDRAEVRIGDALRFLERAMRTRLFFDVVFADPPYVGSTAQRIVDVMAAAATAVCRTLIVEHGHPVFVREGGSIELVKTRQFGQTMLSYFRSRKEVGEGEGEGSALPGNL